MPKGIAVKLPTGTKVSMTVADYVAQMLTESDGAPPYLLFWPEAKKVTARKEMAAWLSSKTVDWMAVVKANPLAKFDLYE